MSEDFDEIIKLEDKIERLEDDVKLCYEEIKGLETEIETLKKKGNVAMEIIDCQGEQIGQLIDIIEIYSKCFDNISDVVEQLSKNKYKCIDTSQKYAKFGTMDLTSARLEQILKEAPQQREIHLGEPPVKDGRRIPFYEEEHPDYKPETNNLRKELVGSITVRLKQVFKTIDGNLILGIEFGREELKYRIHKYDFIKIHSCYNNEDFVYFGEIKALKRFKDSLDAIPINSTSRDYGIEIPTMMDYNFNYYIHGDIVIDIYR